MARNRRLKHEWTSEAEMQWAEILRFYVERNGSSTYSRRLQKEMKSLLRGLCINPEWGRKTVIPAVRWRLVENFIAYYTAESDRIIVLSVWDTRRDPDGFPYLLEETENGSD